MLELPSLRTLLALQRLIVTAHAMKGPPEDALAHKLSMEELAASLGCTVTWEEQPGG